MCPESPSVGRTRAESGAEGSSFHLERREFRNRPCSTAQIEFWRSHLVSPDRIQTRFLPLCAFRRTPASTAIGGRSTCTSNSRVVSYGRRNDPHRTRVQVRS